MVLNGKQTLDFGVKDRYHFMHYANSGFTPGGNWNVAHITRIVTI